MDEEYLKEHPPEHQDTVWRLRGALEDLKAQWVRLGGPIVDALQPGISPHEVDELSAPHGITVPPEIKALWQWHNGAQPAPGLRALPIGPGHFEFLSAQQAFEAYEMNRRMSPESEIPEVDPEMYWHVTWLPFMTQDAQRLYVDCSREPCQSHGSPIRMVAYEWGEYDVDLAMSLRHAVVLWTWLLAQGFYRVTDRGFWSSDWERIPSFVRRTGLA